MLRLKREDNDKPNINADRQNQKGERASILESTRTFVFP